PRVSDGAGELAENRDAGDELVAIPRTAAADQHDGRQPPAHAFGPRQRAHEREAAAADLHLLVVGARNRHAPRRDRRDVLAHGAQNGLGSSTASAAIASTLSATCPAFTTCEVAVVPLTVVLSDSGCARIVASIVRSIGFHSASYRICSRRVTRSTDAARRPE